MTAIVLMLLSVGFGLCLFICGALFERAEAEHRSTRFQAFSAMMLIAALMIVTLLCLGY